jgi:hypothetical protein
MATPLHTTEDAQLSVVYMNAPVGNGLTYFQQRQQPAISMGNDMSICHAKVDVPLHSMHMDTMTLCSSARLSNVDMIMTIRITHYLFLINGGPTKEPKPCSISH